MSSKAHPPELKKRSALIDIFRGRVFTQPADGTNAMYMDKQVKAKLNGGRIVEGVLRGFDPFLNLVIEQSVEIRKTGERIQIGTVVMRGSSIVMLEALDRIS